MASVKNSPENSLFGTFDAVEAISAIPEFSTKGLNFGSYDIGIFVVTPSGGANPTIEIVAWDPLGEQWISANPKAEFAGLGADIPFTFAVPAYGRILYPRVAVLAAGSVSISACGYAPGSF